MSAPTTFCISLPNPTMQCHNSCSYFQQHHRCKCGATQQTHNSKGSSKKNVIMYICRQQCPLEIYEGINDPWQCMQFENYQMLECIQVPRRPPYTVILLSSLLAWLGWWWPNRPIVPEPDLFFTLITDWWLPMPLPMPPHTSDSQLWAAIWSSSPLNMFETLPI